MGRLGIRGLGGAVWLPVAVAALLGSAVVIAVVGGEPQLRAEGAVKASAGSADLDFHLMSVVGPDGQPLSIAAPSTGAAPDSDSQATCGPGRKIGFAGAQSGPATEFSDPVFNGAELAITQFTTNNPGCPVTLVRIDSGNSQVQVDVDAEQLAADSGVLAVVGPVFSSEVSGLVADFSDAGLALISPSATWPDLTRQGWPYFFRGAANDAVGATATGRYLATAGFSKVCAVSLNYPDTTEVWSLATAAMGTVVDPNCSESLFANSEDFPRIVRAIKQSAPDAVYFSGDAPRAADLVLQLRNAGVAAVFIGGEQIFHREFLQKSGPAARGAIVAAGSGEGREPFLYAYQHSYGRSPGPYAMESYDLTTIVLDGIGSAGVTDRTSMTAYLRQYSGSGIANGKHYQWTTNGELVSPPVSLYQVW